MLDPHGVGVTDLQARPGCWDLSCVLGTATSVVNPSLHHLCLAFGVDAKDLKLEPMMHGRCFAY